jgi:hypothetical protein
MSNRVFHPATVGCATLAMMWTMASHHLIAAAPPGYVDASTFGFNTTDATTALQSAINTGQNVFVPNMGSDWIVTPITLTQDNQEILFESGVVVAAKAGVFLGDEFLFVAPDRQNVKMIGYGATLKMRKSDYTQPPYTHSEHRHGIVLGTVNNFEIRGLTIKDTGGDGIYVGGSGNLYSENVLIKDVILDNNYRQGISVISAKDLTIDNAVILNTNGTSPQAGIDFEPNFAGQRLENVVVRNSIINANGTHGILFATNNLSDPAQQVSGTIENVTLVSNTGSGIKLNQPLPEIAIKDSLFVSNNDSGVDGPSVTFDLILNGPDRNSIDYSAFWANSDGPNTGWTTRGPGSVTNVQPIFYSTNASSPYFMYLDPSASALISAGASDGQFMGARPVFVPEASAVGAMALVSGIVLSARRRRCASLYR